MTRKHIYTPGVWYRVLSVHDGEIQCQKNIYTSKQINKIIRFCESMTLFKHSRFHLGLNHLHDWVFIDVFFEALQELNIDYNPESKQTVA